MAKQKLSDSIIAGLRKTGKTVDLGGGVQVFVRSASVAASQAITKAVKEKQEDHDALVDLYVSIFIQQVSDPDTYEPVFGPDDTELVKSSVPMGALLAVVSALAGVGAEQAAKN
jgi:hypothetical protein